MFFDTETTGISEEDRIIQVAAIVSELGNKDYKKEFYDELCSCEVPIKIESMAVHGIRQEKIKDKVPFAQTKFKQRFDELNMSENYLIAHNISFDKKMIEKEGYQNNIEYKIVDTLQCAKHMYEIDEEINGYKLPNHKLQTFRYIMFSDEREDKEAQKYGVEIKAHDAIGDVIILKLFFQNLYLRVKERFKIDSYEKILGKMVELTTLPAEVKKINFGEHKGKTLREIESLTMPNKWGKPTGPNYIDWLYREQAKSKESDPSKFNRDLFFSLEKIRNERNSVDIHNNEINF